MPKRQVSEGVLFNIEGSVFRNKARVFTSFYLVNPESLEQKGNLDISEFGKAIGLGFVEESKFYQEILSRFEYPHPAYEENWKEWSDAKKKLRPFLYILDLLVKIYELDGEGSLAVNEVARVAFEKPSHKMTSEYANKIIELRNKKTVSKRERNDQVDRKIGDIFGFLCISGLTFYDGKKIALNLIDRHCEESTLFWEKREGQNRLEHVKKFISFSLKDLL